MSLDSDNMGRLGISQTRKAMPFSQIEADLNAKGRNYAGSPPPVLSNVMKFTTKERNSDHFNSINGGSNNISKN